MYKPISDCAWWKCFCSGFGLYGLFLSVFSGEIGLFFCVFGLVKIICKHELVVASALRGNIVKNNNNKNTFWQGIYEI